MSVLKGINPNIKKMREMKEFGALASRANQIKEELRKAKKTVFTQICHMGTLESVIQSAL